MLDFASVVKSYKSVCWYPSAGVDFRTLMFLSRNYYEIDNSRYSRDGKKLTGINSFPDLFIYTDFNHDPDLIDFARYTRVLSDYPMVWGPKKVDKVVLYKDVCTLIQATNITHLGSIPIKYDAECVTGSMGKSPYYGQAVLMDVHINSRQLGQWDTKLIYVIGINECFAQYLCENKINCDYVTIVRYGECFGGAANGPVWIADLIKPLNMKYILAAQRYFYNDPRMKSVYKVDERFWSNNGDISWFKILPD